MWWQAGHKAHKEFILHYVHILSEEGKEKVKNEWRSCATMGGDTDMPWFILYHLMMYIHKGGWIKA